MQLNLREAWMRQRDNAALWSGFERMPGRLWSAGRTTGQLLLAFAASFALTAGMLLLAHV